MLSRCSRCLRVKEGISGGGAAVLYENSVNVDAADVSFDDKRLDTLRRWPGYVVEKRVLPAPR